MMSFVSNGWIYILTNKAPPRLFDVVEITTIPGVRIAVASGVDAAQCELMRFLGGEIPTVPLIKDAICVCAPRADTKHVVLEACAISIHVVH
jgi:hypothetical protein